jgi:hypothetical protein
MQRAGVWASRRTHRGISIRFWGWIGVRTRKRSSLRTVSWLGKFHPDVNKEPDAEAKFKDISAAYEVLADEEKKSIYDRFGEDGLKGGGMGAGFGGMGSDFTNPMDIFESFFGGEHGRDGRDGWYGRDGWWRCEDAQQAHAGR